MPEIKQAVHALRTIISDAEQDAVTWMQALSKPQQPWRINGKVEDMRQMRIVDEPLLSFERYNVRLEDEPLRTLMGDEWAKENLTLEKLEHLQQFDIASKVNLTRLTDIGRAAAQDVVKPEHFTENFDVWFEH